MSGRTTAMSRLGALAFALALAGCGATNQTPATPSASIIVPSRLQVCPDGKWPRPPPPPPRTMKQFIEWVADVHSALVATEKARAECAHRLVRLNEWIAARLASAADAR
jgi:hypothetical protein